MCMFKSVGIISVEVIELKVWLTSGGRNFLVIGWKVKWKKIYFFIIYSRANNTLNS